MTLAMVWPCASPEARVRRIIMSRVPLSMSLARGWLRPMRCCLHSNFYGREHTPLGVL